MCKRVILTLIGILVLLPPAPAAITINSEFEKPGVSPEPFADWVTFLPLFNNRPSVSTDVEGAFATFSDSSPNAVTLWEQDLFVPEAYQAGIFELDFSSLAPGPHGPFFEPAFYTRIILARSQPICL